MKTKPKAKKPAAKPARRSRPPLAKAQAPDSDGEKKFQPEDYQIVDPSPRQEFRWVEVECPYCGETFDVRVDPAEEGQSLVQDCQVCCKPVQLSVDVEDGEISIFASRG